MPADLQLFSQYLSRWRDAHWWGRSRRGTLVEHGLTSQALSQRDALARLDAIACANAPGYIQPETSAAFQRLTCAIAAAHTRVDFSPAVIECRSPAARLRTAHARFDPYWLHDMMLCGAMHVAESVARCHNLGSRAQTVHTRMCVVLVVLRCSESSPLAHLHLVVPTTTVTAIADAATATRPEDALQRKRHLRRPLSVGCPCLETCSIAIATPTTTMRRRHRPGGAAWRGGAMSQRSSRRLSHS